MLLLEIDIDDDRAQAYFDYAGYHVRSMTEPFGRIANRVWMHMTLQFDSEGQHLSGGWAELAPATVQDRGSAHPILEREGILKRDVLQHPARGSEFGGGLRFGNGWLTLDPESWRDGVDLVEVHTEGRESTRVNRNTGQPSGGMPPRPIWETPRAFGVEVEQIASEWLDELKASNIRRRGRDIPLPTGISEQIRAWDLA